MPATKDIFDGSSSEEETAVGGDLTINKKYAAQLAKRKEKEAMMKAMAEESESDFDDSTSEEEDSDAELLTEKVEMKIFETIAKIKNKDPSIYQSTDAPIFTEDDFADSTADNASATKHKKTTYKDLVRETILNEGTFPGDDQDERPAKRLKTPKQLEEEARLAFKAAVAEDEEADNDDGLVLTQKAEPLSKEESIERAKKLSSSWAGVWEETTDENELFLRDYLLNERWKERESLQTASGKKKQETAEGGVSDTEDEEYLEKTDDFEREYNFRFEEEGGTKITGHARQVEDSVRLKDDKRKRKREELKQKKEELKKQKEEELKRLKNLKMQELNRRLDQIAQVTGNKRSVNSLSSAAVLDTEFDPDQHDQELEQLLGQDYYDQPDEDYQDREAQEDEQGGDWQGQEEEGEWFLCDGCEKPIQPGKRMYECRSCEDFVVCGGCQKKIDHPHKLHREVVPEHCVPPADWGKVEETKEKAMDEMFAMDFEDVIAGGIATRFKYRKVEKEDYGLSADDILNKPDSYLNKKVSLKKIYPYRNQ